MRYIRKIFVSAAVTSFLSQSGILRPQTPRLEFEVASVKGGRADRQISMGPVGGRFVATSTPLKWVIQRAYAPSNGRQLLRNQIIGGPQWIDTELFDIEAKAEDDSRPTPDHMWLMVRTLMEDRFQLKAHRETRDLPVYNLVVVKSGRVKLSQDQTPIDLAAPRIFDPASAPRGAFRMVGKPSATALTLVISGNSVRMDTFINILSQYADRPLIDKTGLPGMYDIELQFEMASGISRGDAGAVPVASDPGIGTMFTALQEQLGLKLESARGPIEVLVIDHVERPSEN